MAKANAITGADPTIVYQVSPQGQLKGMTPTTNRRIVGAGVSTCAPTVIL